MINQKTWQSRRRPERRDKSESKEDTERRRPEGREKSERREESERSEKSKAK